MKVILTHPTGNRNVRAVMTGLDRADMLAEFNTTLASSSKAFWLNALPQVINQHWTRRSFPLPSKQIKTYPWRELARMTLPRIGLKNWVQHEVGWASVDAVYQNLDKAVARRLNRLAGQSHVGAVYAYEDGALTTFTTAKELGLKCIYDLPIAFWETGRKLMTEEADRFPAWAPTLSGGLYDSAAKLERKTRELELADVIICPGTFVLNSLPAWATHKRKVTVPFGSPHGGPLKEESRPEKQRPLRVLFAGSLGQRKGLADLFTAVRLLNRSDVELVIMGSLLAPMAFYRSQGVTFTYEPGRPHEQVLALMRSCDVFCLPSIVEGRALVMQEAMSQGLPLIITPNTGGADLIQEGHTGFLVPIRSPEAIAEKLTWFLEHRSEVPRMGRMAQARAAQYSWESYGAQIAESLTHCM